MLQTRVEGNRQRDRRHTRASRHFFPVVSLLLALAFLGATPYQSKGVFYVTASADGRYVAFINWAGNLRVANLESRREIFAPPRGDIPSVWAGHAAQFAAFDTSAGRVLWNCAVGRVCWRDLESGGEGVLLDHDPQDDVLRGVVSADGKRMVFGTLKGRVFTFDPGTGEQRELKPADAWSPRQPIPVYVLEGTPQLDRFVSASSYISPLLERFDFGDRPFVYTRPGQRAVQIKHSGIVVWSYESGEAHEIFDGFQDKVFATFSQDGNRLAIRQSTHYWRSYRLPDLALEREAIPQVHPAGGVAFLDPAGDYVGMVSYAKKRLEVYKVGPAEPPSWLLRLRGSPEGGARVLATVPQKGWVFVGMKAGGVEWYRFTPGNPPKLKFLAKLK